MDIIKTIRDNKLMYLTIDKLIKQLSSILKISADETRKQVNDKIENGELFLDDSGKVSISKDRGYYTAKLSLNKKGYGFASIDGAPDIFIPAFGINGAFDGDDCLVEITSVKTEEDVEGRVVRILKRNTTHVVGTYIEGKNKNVVFPDDPKLPQIRIYKPDSNKAKNNDKVWVEIDKDTIGLNSMNGKVVEILGQANTPKAEQMSIIRSFGLIEQFESETQIAANAINQTIKKSNFKKRTDYTAHNVITIDGEDARDFDDALSIKRKKDGGYTLYVHIADVSNYVVENSALDKTAYKRGTSVYFPNMVIPMLPKELSNGVCSLCEGENRLTLTCEIELDKDIKVIKSTLHEGIIKSRHRMTYTEVQNILNGNEELIEKFKDVYQDILDYRRISSELQNQKKQRGEIRLNLPEPYILENQKGEIVSIENRVQDEAHEIIEDLMVLTNECVAKKFRDENIPFVYRVHEKPEEEKRERLAKILKNLKINNEIEKNGDNPAVYQKIIEKLTGDPKEKILTKMILRTMMKARYAPTCLGHFGLASENYCHFTSPIRRYPDLLIHRIIKEFLNGVPKDELKLKYKAIVERASEQSSTTERNADEAERAVDDYKKAVYMSNFLGQEFSGSISGVQEFGIFVELENGIEGMVKLDDLPYDEYVYDEMLLSLYGKKNHFSIGDNIQIVVASTNTQLRQINFTLPGVQNAIRNYVVKKQDKSKLKNKKLNTQKKEIKSKNSKKILKINQKKHKKSKKI